MKYFIYVRKSSEQEDRQAMSISSQIRELTTKFTDLEIVEILEEQHSAFIPDSRPVFQSLLNRIIKKEADGIISWHPDRLSRNEIDAAKITYMIRTSQIMDLKFGNYYFDNSPEGIMMLQLALSQSQYFSSKLSKDIQRGNREKYQRGGISWTAPIGYLNNRDTGILDEDPERFPLIQKMWKMLLENNYSAAEIHRIATEEWKLKTLKRRSIGGRELSQSTIYKIFTNPLYCGLNIRPDGTQYKCNHKPIISEEEFWRAQIILGKRGKRRPQAHNFSFTGLITCGECGSCITAQEMYVVNKTNNKIRHYVHYRCTKKRKDIKCSQPYINLKDLENQFDTYLEKITISQKYVDWMLKYLDKANDNESNDRNLIYKNHQNELVNLDKQLSNLIKLRVKNEISADEFHSIKSELMSEKSKLLELSSQLEQRADNWIELAENTLNFVARARYWFNNGTNEDKRLIFQTITGSNAKLKDKQISFEPVSIFKVFENIPDNKKTPAEQMSSWWT